MKKSAVLFLLAFALGSRAQTALSVCGDIFPPGSPGAMDCGDGVVNALDAEEAIYLIENNITPTDCQLINGDVPNGIPEFCGYPPGTFNCALNGVFDIYDYMVIADKAMGRINCCDYCYLDADRDGFMNDFDNCPNMPNGPYLGTCTVGKRGASCRNNEACGVMGVCSLNQEDNYPPSGNGVGDACDCEGNFDCDGDVDGTDASMFKEDFGRSIFYNQCPACR
jgi:hypothetical protein